jgi:ACS family hexuronate transporter-like MFS transporter
MDTNVKPLIAPSPLEPPGIAFSNLRWLIVGLVFLATFINFIDRLTISVLAPVIRANLHLSNLQYAQIGTWFLVAYTLSQGLSGRMYDRVGTKGGFTISIVI